MRPGPHSPLQASHNRLQADRRCAALRGALGIALLAGAAPGLTGIAFAQEGAAPGVDTAQEQVPPFPETGNKPLTDTAPAPAPPTPTSPIGNPPGQAVPAENANGERQVGFEADLLSYDNDTDTVNASGNVVLRSGDQSVRADKVTWNRMTGQIVAEGGIRLVDADGNQLFTDRLELTDELKAGAMQNLLLVFRTGGRLAAEMAERNEAGDIEVTRASYSTCPVEDEDGCPKQPSWRITAERVVYDTATRQVRFSGAYLELFGHRVLPLPGLAVGTGGEAKSGFFIPDLGYSASNGFEASDSFYWRIGQNRDLTASAYAYTEAAPMVSAQYRQLTGAGVFQATGYLTYGNHSSLVSPRFPLAALRQTSEKDIRGYIFANGRFQLDPYWTLEGSLRLASDRTFLRRYDITREDRLRSVIRAQRIDSSSYLSIAGWAAQALLVDTPQGQVPLALPEIDYRKRLADPLLGGTLELQANTLAITRSAGQDTQRAFARAQWDFRRITPWGQLVTVTGLVRGDVYHSTDNDLNPTAFYRGLPGWQSRGVAIGAVDVQWPLIGSFLGGTQIITPRLQLVASPAVRNFAIPNEDSRAIELEDSNVFALNRFPGYDRVEEGVRLTYGFDWQVDRPGWRFKSTIGQSYRLSDKPNLFPDGTGLNEQFSDWVGRTEVRYRDFLKFTHRFRLDKDGFAVRRNEVDATLGTDATYIELGYLRLNRDIDPSFEDLQDREELRTAGRWEFLRHWSVFGSAVVNLTDRQEDPTNTSDGFQPLRTRLGFAYQDDCLEFGLTWRRDYVALADSQRGNSFSLTFALRNLGI